MRELINVAKALPAPKNREPKVIEAFIENDVRAKLRERRQNRIENKQVPVKKKRGT